MSSSSSEYQCGCDSLYDGFGRNIFRGTEFYPMTQPFVYYNQVQRPLHYNIMRKENSKRENINCFARAFRWYTQEHVPFNKLETSTKSNNENIREFANWLDDKYNEYLQTVNYEQNQQIVINNTSTVKIDESAKISCEPCTLKKPRRMKTPWDRRRKPKKEENGDVIITKSVESIVVILKPKELSQQILQSGRDQRSKNKPNCCARSSSTVESNRSTGDDKIYNRRRCRSLADVDKEKELIVIQPDIPTNREIHPKNATGPLERNSYPPEKRSSHKFKKTKDVACQCSKYMFQRTNASSQYDKMATAGINVSTMTNSRNKSKADLAKKATMPEIFVKKAKCEASMKNIKCTEQCCPSVPLFNEHCVQTSEQAINLTYGNINQYPLLMKFLCVDKGNIKYSI